ncbi:MAG: transketolase family protein [bacterium]
MIRKKKSTRNGYGEGLVELGGKNPNVVVLDADVSCSTKSDMFKKIYPDRFFNVGIAEQNLITVASGLALAGKIPFATAYGAFITRGWEQIRISACYAKLNVKIAGTHCGIMTGPDGATHQILEDISIMRVLPNMTVIVPCDAVEAKKATIAMASHEGPCYIRLGRSSVPVITKEDTPFEIGKAEVLKDGSDITLIACGYMINEVLQAAEILLLHGVRARVINMHTIKPMDENIVITAAMETGGIITVEEHQLMGGLGSAVAEVVVRKAPVPMDMIGIRNQFGTSGSAEELLRKYHLKDIDIVKATEHLLSKKKGNRKKLLHKQDKR